jgi:MbtH protein
MSMDVEETKFVVVVNHEEQYSIWPTHRALPAGWRSAGMTGNKTDCLAHIDRCWTDLRPKSLREHLAGATSGHVG